MEKELAKRLAEKAAKGELPASPETDAPNIEVEPAPDSGVRSSVPTPFKVADDSMRPLTYSMYTVSELDEVRAPPNPSQKSGPTSGWSDVGRSSLALLRILGSWARTAKPRPRLADHVRVPVATLGVDLRTALGRLPWKKIGVTTLIAFGALLVFFLAVVTVAELTDDLKPSRGAAAASKYNLQGSSETTSARIAAPAQSEADPPVQAQIELDDEPAKAAKPATPAPKAKPKAPKKPKPADMFNP